MRSIRHLHESGAVPEPARTSGNYRDYSVSDLAAVMRARALIDAGVPVSNLNSEDAVPRSIMLLDDRIKHLQRQRARLVALTEAPQGAPDDVRTALSEVLVDPQVRQVELDSWDLMALTGVATPATWDRLRSNLRHASCIDATLEASMLWNQLGEMRGDDARVPGIVDKLKALMPRGLMRGIPETLKEGNAALGLADVPARGAQAETLIELAGSFDE